MVNKLVEIVLDDNNKYKELNKIAKQTFIGISYKDGKFSLEYLPKTKNSTSHLDRIIVLGDKGDNQYKSVSLRDVEKIFLYKNGKKHTQYHNHTHNNGDFEIKKRNIEVPGKDLVLNPMSEKNYRFKPKKS